ncbi:hypothetical protein [Lachnoclostridium phytofermentans]|uniref:NADPH-dependent FMN reductase-like domain-containing protein n=1 Tax=Lachnoclostridium phytofermentans (strain ATCC 700394 / DSM 18823 / ISDg) TaxID=357809 RepID=A9KNS2_LACP7|nr:hypothetical protein [Lachnoclostridium phytofermentans]ABX41673.1 hypothetical protein Cphy_1295 [Lachnoclostridium phytofermentans ISDg]
MSKNIVVINGSPRKNGNSELLVDAFIEGANGSGNKVTISAGRESGKDYYQTCKRYGRPDGRFLFPSFYLAFMVII